MKIIGSTRHVSKARVFVAAVVVGNNGVRSLSSVEKRQMEIVDG